MSRGRFAGIAAVVALAAVAFVAAGCGAGSIVGSFDPVAQAATKTENAGAARIRFSFSFGASGHSFAMNGTGVLDGKSAEMSFELGSLLRQLGPSAFGSSTATMSQLQHATLREIALDENGHYVFYLGSTLFASELPAGKQWLEIDLSKLGTKAGVDLNQLMSTSQVQPSDLLAALESEASKVQNLGSATVDGVATTHYRVTIDTAKTLRGKGLTSPLFRSVAAKLPSLPEDVWVGKDGLVHKLQTSFSLKSVLPLTMAMTMDFYGYGAQVTIAAPPAAEVTDATKLLSAGAGHTGTSSGISP